MAKVKKQRIKVIPTKLVCNTSVGISVAKLALVSTLPVINKTNTPLILSKEINVNVVPDLTGSSNETSGVFSSEKCIQTSTTSTSSVAQLGGTTLLEINSFEKGFKYICEITKQIKEYTYSIDDHIMYSTFELPKPTNL